MKKKVIKTIGVVFLFTMGVVYGIGVINYQWPPYQLIRVIVIYKNQDQFFEIPNENLETDVEKLISITKPEDVSRLRSELINFLWGEPNLPLTIPSKITRGFKDDRYDDISSLDRIDKLSMMMEFGLESHVYHFIPKTPNNKVVLYHQGHNDDIYSIKENVIKLLDEGYSVLSFCMPLMGLNNKKPTINFPRFGRIKIKGHRQMKFLNPTNGHPVKYFLEPVIEVLNYIETNFSYSQISMTGLSGGGWTTTLVSAIDTRIQNSFPVAGSNPFYLVSNDPASWGEDYEHSIPELYRITNNLELYILGSYGTGRRQVQILNQFDICCYSGVRFRTYDDILRIRLQKLGLGKFEVFLDTSHKSHIISDVSINLIIDQLNTP